MDARKPGLITPGFAFRLIEQAQRIVKAPSYPCNTGTSMQSVTALLRRPCNRNCGTRCRVGVAETPEITQQRRLQLVCTELVSEATPRQRSLHQWKRAAWLIG
jgi:hypothetical protein